MPQALPAYQTTEMQGAQAIGAWQRWMSSLYGLETDVYGDAQFTARLGTFALGRVGMTKIESHRHRVRRSPSRPEQSACAARRFSCPARLRPSP